MLTENDITKFQTLYREEFGVDLTREAAVEQALGVFTVMSVIYKPMTEGQVRTIDAHRFNTEPDLVDRLSEDEGCE